MTTRNDAHLTPVPQDLLRHAAFLRRLAGSLLADPHAAEDVLQDTWRAGLERPPRGDARGWLARVLHNFVRRRFRAEARRVDREREVARPEALPAAESELERNEILQHVVDAVSALPEPTRATILARYYEGLPPRLIAERAGLSVETVNARLKRGLSVLRERLGGENRSWRSALGFLASRTVVLEPSGAPRWSIGSLQGAAALLVAAAGAWGTWRALQAPGPSGRDGGVAPPAELIASLVSTPPLLPAPRVPLSPDPTLLLGSTDASRVAGRVLDESGTPVQGARVLVLADEDPCQGETGAPEIRDPYQGRAFATDADGRWSAELVAPSRVFVILGESESIEPLSSTQPERQVQAPAEAIDFVVRRIPLATLSVRVVEGAARRPLQRFSVVIHGSWSRAPEGGVTYTGGYFSRSTEEGVLRFELGVREPAGRTLSVVLGSPWLGDPGSPLEPSMQPRQEILLRGGETREIALVIPERGRVSGFVVDTLGAPVADAIVYFGEETRARGDEPFKPLRPERITDGVRTAADGWFELAGSGTRVTASHAAHSSATAEIAAPGHIVLPPRGALRGRLLDATGTPCGDRSLRLDQRRSGPELRTDADGGFAFEQVEAGAHALWSGDEGAVAGTREPLACLRLAPGEEAWLELVCARAERFTLALRAPSSLDPSALRAAVIGREPLFDLRIELTPGDEPGTLTFAAPRPGRYWLASQAGLVGSFDVVPGSTRAVLEQGSSALVVRGALSSVQVVPADADPFLRLLAARARVRVDPEHGARFALAPGRYLVVGEAGAVAREVELPPEGLEIRLE